MTPTDLIQRLRLVLTDRALSLAERVAVAAIVLHAGRDGIAWPGYRRIRSLYGLNFNGLAKALGEGKGRGKAIGRHLERIGRGAHGSWRFRVLPPGASVTPTIALDDPPTLDFKGASATLPPRQRYGSEAPALRPAERNVNSTDKREPTAERKEERGCAATPAVSPVSATVQPTTETETATAGTKGKDNGPKAAADPRIRSFLDFFCAAYLEAHGRKYLVARGKDAGIVKGLLARLDGNGDGLPELKAAAAAMLADAKYGRDNASLAVLAGQINSWCAKAHKERTHVRRAGELAYSREAEPLPRVTLADKPADGPGA